MDQLRTMLQRLEGKSYKAYKDIKGRYSFDSYSLIIDHVQGDPFAVPSRVRVRVEHSDAKFPVDTFHNSSREIALRDFLAREFDKACRKYSKGRVRGSGNSGEIRIEVPGQEILERSSVIISGEFIEVRFRVGLPAFGRRIAGEQAISMFFDELPQIVSHSLFYQNLDSSVLYRHVEVSEDADELRSKLGERGLVAFVADGSVLPRASGIDNRPLAGSNVVPFKSPETFRVRFKLPNCGEISGMGIPCGITLIVGGGYHGKSTLLKAVEAGVYNHVPGDGREFVVTDECGMKIRAFDGRSVEKVNISPFIDNLPFGLDTAAFSTQNASGSTSQAANIIEAVEIGARVLLIDEDTSATNFMIRDRQMQELISKDSEPITPFIDKARQLFQEHSVSTILVIGGSGDYFSVADHVIGMKNYSPLDVTSEAVAIAEKYRTLRQAEGGESFGSVTPRCPVRESIDPSRGRRDVKISTKGLHTIVFGTYTIKLTDLEQLVDIGQTRAIADTIFYAVKFMKPGRTLVQVIESVLSEIRERGFDILDRIPSGEYTLFRRLELAGAFNRLRSIQMKQTPPAGL